MSLHPIGEAPDGSPSGLNLSTAFRWDAINSKLMAPIERIPTGFDFLDAALRDGEIGQGGFVYPSLVVLGAEPKIGKSTVAQVMAENHVAASPTNVSYYLDLENGIERHYRRRVFRRARIGNDNLLSGLSGAEKKRVNDAAEYFANEQRYLFDDDHALAPQRFTARLRKIRRVMGPDAKLLVVVDSLQKLPVSNLKDRRAGIDGWLRAFEHARNEIRCVLLMISELKRPPDGKTYKADGMSYKESGDIEYTVDLAMDATKCQPGGSDFKISVTWGRDGQHLGEAAKYRLVKPYHEVEEMELKL